MPFRGRVITTEQIDLGLHLKTTAQGKWFIVLKPHLTTLSPAALSRSEEEGKGQRSFSDTGPWMLLAWEARNNPDIYHRIIDLMGHQLDERDLKHLLSLHYADYLTEIGEEPDPAGHRLWTIRNRYAQLQNQQDCQLIVSADTIAAGVVQVHTADGQQHFVTEQSFAQLSLDAMPKLSHCVRVEPSHAAA